MVWQDFVFTGGGFVLTAGLVPMLRSSERPPLRTSLTLLAVLSSYVVVLASLDLWLSATGTALQAAIWGVLALQRFRRTRRWQAQGNSALIMPGDAPPAADGEASSERTRVLDGGDERI